MALYLQVLQEIRNYGSQLIALEIPGEKGLF
jgi:hypothetical protein